MSGHAPPPGPLGAPGAEQPHPDAERLRRFCHAVLGVLGAAGPGAACAPDLPRELARAIGAGVGPVADAVRREADALAAAVANLTALPSRFLDLGPALAGLEAARATAARVADTLDAFRGGPPALDRAAVPAEVPDLISLDAGVPAALTPVDSDPDPESLALPEPVAFPEPDAGYDFAPDDNGSEQQGSPEPDREPWSENPDTNRGESPAADPPDPLTVQADDTLAGDSHTDPATSRLAARVFLQAEKHQKRQNFEAAEALYSHAIAVDPRFGSAYARRGLIRLAHGEVEDAIADFDAALRLDRTAVDARWWRGDAHALAGDLDAAVADYTRVLAAQPDLVRARFNLAVALRQKGEHRRALAEFTTVIRTQPTNAKAYLKRGEVHLKLGNRGPAEADFRMAVTLDPGCEPALQHLLDLPPEDTDDALPSPSAAPAALAPAPAATPVVAPKSSAGLARTTGPQAAAGTISVSCPSCGRLGEVSWDRLNKVMACPGCAKKFVVKAGGEAAEVIEKKGGGWVEAEVLQAERRRTWKRRRTVAAVALLAVLVPALVFVGWKVTHAGPQVVERELPKELTARAELFGQAWMAHDANLMHRLTAPELTKKGSAWYARHRPPPHLRPPERGVPPDGVEGAKVDVATRPGTQGRTVVTLRLSNAKLAPDKPPAELTLAWEERPNGDWYFVP